MRMLGLWPRARPRRSTETVGLRVLIADEDPYVRAELEQFVCQRGCHVYFAADGTVALRCLALARDRTRNFGPIDVVIADADLPGRSGIDLLMAARDQDWDLRVVLTSAFVSPLLRGELVRLGAAAVLAKPISLSQLESALERIREQRPPR
jgi:CheY-like chemotaxis protein